MNEFVIKNGYIAQKDSVVSGSLAVSNGITGNLTGTASSALTASYALFAANGGGGGISAIFIGDEGTTQGTASYFNFVGAGVTATVSNNTASISIEGGGGGGTQGLSTTFTQSVAAATWSFYHNLNTRFPLIQVYDSSFNQITPQYVSSSNASYVEIGFGIPTSGYAVASNGGTLIVTGSNVILDQSVSSATWSFAHNLNTQYPIFQVFNASNEVVIPERIVAVDSSSALIYFPTPLAGKAVASFAGISGSLGGGTGAGFPYSGSAVITGSLLVSGSGITGSLLGTASYATQTLSSSFATYAVSASNAPGFTVTYEQSTPAATWSFTHNLNTRNPIVQVYDSTYKQIIPNEIVATSGLTTEIRFDYNESGYVVFSNGGGLYITGSTSQLNQTVGAATWSFQHNLNSKYVNFEVYDSNDLVIIPAGIRALNSNQAELYFSTAQTGIAVANFSGISGSTNAVTASYALTATSSSYAMSSSYGFASTSASYAVNATSAATASYANAFTVAGTLTAQTLVVQTITSSVDFVTGSTRFGSTVGNTHQFTGSVSVSGSVGITGALTLNSAANSVRTGNELRFYRADNAIYTQLYDGGNANGFVLDNRNGDGFSFQSAGTNQLRIAPTGAATFSSSVAIGGAGLGLTGINMPNQNYLAWYASGGSGGQNVAIRGNGDALELSSGGGLTMTLSASKNVGIGTSSPSYILSVNQFNTSGEATIGITNTSTGSNTTKAATLMFSLTDTVGTVKPSGGIYVYPDSGLPNVQSAYMLFATRSGDGGPYERMRITSGGNVLVGGTSDVGGLVGSVILPGGNFGTGQENKSIFYSNRYSSGTGCVQLSGNWASPGTWGLGPDTNASDSVVRIGQVTSNSNGFYWTGTYVSLKGASFPTTSDYRIKTNVIESKYGLAEVLNLRPVKYNQLVQDEDGNKIAKDKAEIGFIAHEVQEIIPEVVNGVKDEIDNNGNQIIQSLEYSRLIPVLVKAIQELTARVQELENK